MDPQLSLLLYSKYSSLSKSLMNRMNTSGIDFTNKFSLQPLCIDNEEIRKRILKNKNIEVTTVPCLLIIFPDGGIEKYDGAHVFEWVEEIIRKFAPPPPPPPQPRPPQQSEEEKWLMEQERVKEKKMLEDQQKEKERARIREENRRAYEAKKGESHRDENREREQPPTQHRRRQVRKPSPEKELEEQEQELEEENELEQEHSNGVTSIDDLEELPTDEEDIGVSDRYRSRKPVGRIRSDQGNYEEGKDLFQGPTVNMRNSKKSAVKDGSHTGNDAKSQKSIDIMSRAKALAKGREDSNPAPPPGHPLNQRM